MRLASLGQETSRQAYMLATNEMFWLCGWIFLLLTTTIWLAKGPFAVDGPKK
jgi:DHA2 family multidrug resistance protein